MKKIIIFMITAVLLTGCGCEKEQDNTTKKEPTDSQQKVKTVKVTDGTIKTTKDKGFSFDLKTEGKEGVIVIKNVSAKKDQAYLANFTINTKDGLPVNTIATIPPNLSEDYIVTTHIEIQNITSFDYELSETTIKK